MKNISEIVRKHLKEKNIKNIELANYLGIKPQNLISLLQTENWSFNSVMKVSEFLKINLYDFADNNIMLSEPETSFQRDVFVLLKERFETLESDIKELKKENVILRSDIKKLSQK